MSKSKKDVSREQFLQMADLLGQSPVFCALVEDDTPESRFSSAELRDGIARLDKHCKTGSHHDVTPHRDATIPWDYTVSKFSRPKAFWGLFGMELFPRWVYAQAPTGDSKF